MKSEYTHLKEESVKARVIFKPEFFRLSVEEDKKKFNDLIKSGFVFLYDEIYDQLKELFKSRNPSSRLEAGDYRKLIENHLNGGAMDDYGVWVYYPWSRRIVHILDEEEYVELRTAANKNKITTAERNILAKKKVGVIGLSVGQSVSVTMAMERSCGELRLADFDTLELNNLNRIRTGVHNLGLLKAYSVAREIAELDPYFKVVCYTDGITDDNINDFFLEGGKLDAVIDECDGVNIKILCRVKARELQVPVLMEASDRGTLDVERFDLEPDRPIMHGWLQHLNIDLDVLKNLKTNADKLPYILPIAGLETLSSRMKASMIEMQVTLTTWPQLATAVTLGGAVTADTCRRIFLNQYTNSGRYFIDMEALVPDERAKEPFIPEPPMFEITEADMKSLSLKALQKLPPATFSPVTDQIIDMVNVATKAPSAGNSQPWKWYYKEDYLFLFNSNNGIISFGDFEHMASNIAHGAAIENIILEADKFGMKSEVQLFPIENENKLVAAIRFEKGKTEGLYHPAELVKYIEARVTNRNEGNGQAIGEDVLQSLKEAVRTIPGADILIKSSPDEFAQFANIIGPSERLKLLNPASHYEFFKKELRWSENDSQSMPDGINIKELCMSHPEEIALKMVRDPRSIKLLAEWNGGQALEYTSRKAIASSSAFGLITMPGYSMTNNIMGGRAAQRMWLTATQNNVSVQPMMVPILYFARLLKAEGKAMPDFVKNEFEILRERFDQLFPEVKNREGVFMFALRTIEKPSVRSLRKPLEQVFFLA